MTTRTTKPAYYTVAALYRRRKNGTTRYEWKDLRTFGAKKEATDYAKRESKLSYSDGRTGRYLVTKSVNVYMYEDGKIVK